MDIDQTALDQLAGKIKEMGLTGRVWTHNRSVFDMDFADGSFDIIWSEGSIYTLGFENGLREWRRFLKPGGFLVVHDEKGNIREKVKQISACGYKLSGYFVLSKKTWWSEYFAPLEKQLSEFQKKYGGGRVMPEELRSAQNELDMFKRHPERNTSIYFIMKKRP